MKRLFTDKQVKKFWDILWELGRGETSYYKNNDCQKTVFVRRVFRKIHPYWKLELSEGTGFYKTDGEYTNNVEEIMTTVYKYIAICYIEYTLGWGEDITLAYWSVTDSKLHSLKIDHNLSLTLKGQKISKDKYVKISFLFTPKEKSNDAH